jgi:hypothetical protein
MFIRCHIIIHAACLMSFLTCYDCYTRCHVAIHVHTLSYVHVLHASFVLLLSFVSCHSPYCLTSVTPSPDEQHVINLMRVYVLVHLCMYVCVLNTCHPLHLMNST